jgi:hypothetical protein
MDRLTKSWGIILFQQEAIQSTVFQLTQSEGNAGRQLFITESIFPFPFSNAE